MLVVVEHFSKWIEFVFLPQNFAELTGQPFKNMCWNVFEDHLRY